MTCQSCRTRIQSHTPSASASRTSQSIACPPYYVAHTYGTARLGRTGVSPLDHSPTSLPSANSRIPDRTSVYLHPSYLVGVFDTTGAGLASYPLDAIRRRMTRRMTSGSTSRCSMLVPSYVVFPSLLNRAYFVPLDHRQGGHNITVQGCWCVITL